MPPTQEAKTDIAGLRRRTLGLAVRSVRAASARVGGRFEMSVEKALLAQAWKRAESVHLEGYLVRGYQSPVINVQSILARHHLVKQLFGDRFGALERAELEFAVGKNRALLADQKRRGANRSQLDPGLDEAFDSIMAGETNRFLDQWRESFGDLEAAPLTVVEAACGSANDFRYLAEAGIAAHLDYRGFDLARTNIENAQRAFPGTDFRVGNILEIDAGDGAYRWAIVHDLFEHLSPRAMERAIEEICRVASDGVFVSFFRMADIPEHRIKPQKAYHFNELSMERTRESFLAHCRTVEAIDVSHYVAARYGFKGYYNKRAFTFIARK